jgi:arsenite methyltransferase
MPAGLAARQAMYENGSLGRVTGGPLRPGGWTLTERMLSQCELCAVDTVLDVGCGDGSTVRYLLENHTIHAIGLDNSVRLLRQGHLQASHIPFTCALGTSIPIASRQIDLVLSECSLSAISNADSFLSETWRVLRYGGRLAISDVYIRDPAGTQSLRALPLTCGLRDAFELPELMQCLQKHGFEILAWEDHSEALKNLAGQVALSHGSISDFWSQSEPQVNPLDIVLAISRARVGYFVLIAKKPA